MQPHQQSRLKGLDTLCQRLLNINGTADTILCGTQGQLHLQGQQQNPMRCKTVTVAVKQQCTDREG